MKKTLLSIGITILLSSGIFAQDTPIKTMKMRVWGNCGMCKKTIEQSSLTIDEVQSAKWNIETDTLVVIFDEAALSKKGMSFDNICIAIAEAGYDNQYYKAKTKNYNKLPKCCQYKRPKKK